jgi:hypothetical protein
MWELEAIIADSAFVFRPSGCKLSRNKKGSGSLWSSFTAEGRNGALWAALGGPYFGAQGILTIDTKAFRGDRQLTMPLRQGFSIWIGITLMLLFQEPRPPRQYIIRPSSRRYLLTLSGPLNST